MKRLLYFALFVIMIGMACGGSAPSAKPADTAIPPAATDTPKPTSPPPPTATDTPVPTATSIPTITPTQGPIVVDEDFSTDNGRFKCDYCKVNDGALLMGPFPATDSLESYYAICNECGVAENYKMSVDAWYIEGASDRGFGLLLRENDGSFIDTELTTWQVYGVWNYDKTFQTGYQGWSGITDGFISGWLKPGRAVNHLEVIMRTENGKTTLTVTINDKGSRNFNIKSDRGNVGLLVGMHSLGVAFDNFHFEELP